MRFLIAIVLSLFLFASITGAQYLRPRPIPSSSSLALLSNHPFHQWSLIRHLAAIDSMENNPMMTIEQDIQDQALLEQLMTMDTNKITTLANIDEDTTDFSIQQPWRRGFGFGGFGRRGWGWGGFGGFGGWGYPGVWGGWGYPGIWGGWGYPGFYGGGFGGWGYPGIWGGFGGWGWGRGFGWGGRGWGRGFGRFGRW